MLMQNTLQPKDKSLVGLYGFAFEILFHSHLGAIGVFENDIFNIILLPQLLAYSNETFNSFSHPMCRFPVTANIKAVCTI